jgi:hypothetical protein
MGEEDEYATLIVTAGVRSQREYARPEQAERGRHPYRARPGSARLAPGGQTQDIYTGLFIKGVIIGA